MWVDYLIYGAIAWLFVSIPLILLVFGFFGRLIKLQMKYWAFAKRGFHKIEHMGEDRVIRTYFLRPKDSHFEFDKGIYMIQKETMYKSSTEVMKKIDPKLLSKKEEEVNTQEEKEIIGLLKQIGKMRYDSDSVFMQWGIPTIFYFGNDPNPINPAERKKIYDSKVMLAYIHRLLLEKEWKFVQMVLMLTIIGFASALLLGYLFWGVQNNSTTALLQCTGMLNQSQITIANYLNFTMQVANQSSTIII